MKKLSLFCVSVWMIVSCKEIEKLTEFDMNYTSSVTIAKTTGIDLPITVPTPEVETNSESEFAVNDTRKDMVEEIVLTGLGLAITSPDDQTFSFIEEIEVFMIAEDLPEVRIAYQTEVPEDAGNQLDLETTGQDLKEYIKKDKFELRLRTVTDEILSRDTDIEIDARFFVNAKVLGL